jgi:hypothetical protein
MNVPRSEPQPFNPPRIRLCIVCFRAEAVNAYVDEWGVVPCCPRCTLSVAQEALTLDIPSFVHPLNLTRKESS